MIMIYVTSCFRRQVITSYKTFFFEKTLTYLNNNRFAFYSSRKKTVLMCGKFKEHVLEPSALSPFRRIVF